MEIIIIFGFPGLLIYLWMNLISSIAIKHDDTLNSFQKKTQTILIWLVPYLGSSIVLHMVFDHSPEAIPQKLIPWPFKKLIYGKNIKENKHRHDAGSSSISSGHGGHGSVGDAGGVGE